MQNNTRWLDPKTTVSRHLVRKNSNDGPEYIIGTVGQIGPTWFVHGSIVGPEPARYSTFEEACAAAEAAANGK